MLIARQTQGKYNDIYWKLAMQIIFKELRIDILRICSEIVKEISIVQYWD